MSDELDDQLRALLRDVPAPDPGARERALDAALTVYEQQRAPQHRSTRWLMPVAAALVGVVALAGAVVVLTTDGDGDEASDSADVTALEMSRVESAADTIPSVAAAAATEGPAEEVLAADAAAPAQAAGSDAAPPVLTSDADVIAAVTATIEDEDDDEGAVTACGRPLVVAAIDERSDAVSRPVLLAVEDTPDGGFVVVLVPEGEPDACRELDRLPLP